jgi:capsule biosynthesis phosphatase
MINEDKVIVMDIDGTLCEKKNDRQTYLEVKPNDLVLFKLRKYVEQGFYIILFTSRNMKTHQGNIGRINANTAKLLFEWLDKHDVPYDEIHFGKPWCGKSGFYVDDKAIRPNEFLKYSYEEIIKLLRGEEIL